MQCDTKGDNNHIWLKKEMKDRWRKMRKRVLLTEVKESEEESKIKDLGK